jgi:hypothetical protein
MVSRMHQDSDDDREPAEPTTIEKTAVLDETNPHEGYYGGTFVHGLIASQGNEPEDLAGIEIKETISIRRNDFGPPPKIETAYTEVDEDGMVSDKIWTNAKRISQYVPGLKTLPGIYDTPQKIYWRFPAEEGEAEEPWNHLADVAIEFRVDDRSDTEDEEEDLVATTTDNNAEIEQDYADH